MSTADSSRRRQRPPVDNYTQSLSISSYLRICMYISAREVSGHILVHQDPSDSESNRLHVHIFRFWCFHSFAVWYSTDSYKMMGKFLKSWTSTGRVSNSTGSSATSRKFFLDTDVCIFTYDSYWFVDTLIIPGTVCVSIRSYAVLQQLFNETDMMFYQAKSFLNAQPIELPLVKSNSWVRRWLYCVTPNRSTRELVYSVLYDMSTPFMVFGITCPTLRCTLGFTYDQQLHH